MALEIWSFLFTAMQDYYKKFLHSNVLNFLILLVLKFEMQQAPFPFAVS